MNLEEILKRFKLNESTISTLLGVAVVVVIGALVVNYFRGLDTGNTLPPGANTENLSLPATHTVAQGESLWEIAQIYYDSGYNWVSIADANNLANANSVEPGQVLTIPDVEPIFLANEDISTPNTPTPATSQTTGEAGKVAEVQAQEENNAVPDTVDSYTVQAGDSLWSIAENVYGDGFKWVQIASANHLANPNIIHTGNVFSIPR